MFQIYFLISLVLNTIGIIGKKIEGIGLFKKLLIILLAAGGFATAAVLIFGNGEPEILELLLLIPIHWVVGWVAGYVVARFL